MTDWMLQITVILIGALAAAEIARALRLSSVLGELTVGILLGSSVLGWLPESHLLEVLAELGVIFMIFMVGLETKFAHIRKVGKGGRTRCDIRCFVSLSGRLWNWLGLRL